VEGGIIEFVIEFRLKFRRCIVGSWGSGLEFMIVVRDMSCWGFGKSGNYTGRGRGMCWC